MYQTKSRRISAVGLASCLALVIIAALSGCMDDRMRQLYTTMEGTVTDASGNPIEDASVYVYGIDPKRTTNADGVYQIAWVPLGVIEVIAEKEGYKSAIKNTVIELHEDNSGVDFTLFSVELDTPEIVEGRGVRLQWERSPYIKFAAYELYRSDSENVSRDEVLVARITDAMTSSAFDSIILDEGTYYYKVFVVNTRGEAFASNEVSTQAVDLLAGTLLRDTTLTAAGSPYTISGDLTVAEDVVLAIEPGVTVQFASTDSLGGGEDPQRCELLVEGILDAVGTAASPITFTSADDPANHSADDHSWYWSGITFLDSANDARCLIDEAVITYARVGVKSVLSSPRIRDSIISDCDDGVHAQSSSTIEVTGCSFQNITKWALIASGASPLFKNNKLSGCRNGVWVLEGSDARVENSIIENSTTGIGVYLKDCAPHVSDNQISGNKIGILCRDVTAGRIYNNQVHSSDSENVRLEHSNIEISSNQIKGSPVGIRCLGGAPTVKKNFVEENTTGMVLENECLGTVEDNWIRQNAVYGLDVDGSAPVIRYNTISGTSDGATRGNGINCNNDSAPLISYNDISTNNRNGIYSLDSYPAISSCNFQANGSYAVNGGGVLGVDSGSGGNYLVGNNGAGEEEVDSTIGGLPDDINDWNSPAPTPQYNKVDAVLHAQTSPVPSTGPRS